MQLKERVELFEAAGMGSTASVDRNHAAVEWLPSSKTSTLCRRWVLAAAQTESTDSSLHRYYSDKEAGGYQDGLEIT